MREIRDELEKIGIEMYYLDNLTELLKDYFYNELNECKYSKGESLTKVISDNIKSTDKHLQEVIKRVFEECNK